MNLQYNTFWGAPLSTGNCSAWFPKQQKNPSAAKDERICFRGTTFIPQSARSSRAYGLSFRGEALMRHSTDNGCCRQCLRVRNV